MTVNADVFVDKPVSAEEADRIAAEFAGIGLDADVRVAVPTRSIEAVALTIFATLAFQPFISQLSNDFADDAYVRLKALVTKVLHRKHTNADAGDEGDDKDEPKRVLMLLDADTGLRVVLEPDLPAESFRQLLSLDLTKFTHGPLHYDLARGRWRSELDEQG
jgi:hypothetical protein